MTKSLSERVEKHQKQKSEGKQRTSKAEFIAQKKDIADALRSGWSITAVWETLRDEGKISCGYDAFRKYVKTLIEAKQNTKDGQMQKKKSSNEMDGFSYNPVPNLEELM